MRKAKYEMDMCTGPLFYKIVVFFVPLALSGILQLLYNAADIIVVGRFAGSTSLAAVGATGSLINLTINLFMGLSVGACVVTAQHFGAGEEKELSDTVHTSMTVALICGVAVGALGFFLARPMLGLMATPDDVIDKSTLYVQIYFLGLPALMVYNFGASVLRGVGDTRRPLYFLAVSGVVNVLLNLLFVIVFKMDVAGVAVATVISEVISAVLVVAVLIRSETPYKLRVKRLKISGRAFLRIMRIGLPAGIQSSIFSLSNVIIQSSINSFGSVAMAGNAAAGNIEGFIYTSMNAVSQAALTFTGQNFGARSYKNLTKILWCCSLLVVGVGLLMGGAVYLFAPTLLGIYTTDPTTIPYGVLRIATICIPYFLCGLMEVFVGMLRGIGCSLVPMIVSIAGVCGIRLMWIFTVFASHRTLMTLYISYPASWAFTALVHLICYLAMKNRTIAKREEAFKGGNLTVK